MSHILVIDDEPGIRTVLRDVLNDEGYRVTVAEDGFEGLDILRERTIDLVLLDVWLPNKGGIDVLKEIKASWPDREVIIISGHANIVLAVQAVKIGAFDFLEKPLSLEKTITVVQNALRLKELRKENKTLKTSIFLDDEMIGSGRPMMRVKELMEQSAGTDSRILILGESGTGKELVARLIHIKSKRKSGPFVEVNCAAIPENLIESELFGHEKGAFTNALNLRKGKFELAHRGTLFLDEIGDMSLSTQAKVLRAIQELKFERIGGEESICVDVRFIAATNKNLEQQIKAKKFREDLFFRLNVIPIHVPPLRERLDDLEDLLSYFMMKFKHHGQNEPKTLTEDARAELRKYHWPGNIRELKNFVERVNIMVEVREISKDAVKQYLSSKTIEETRLHFDEYNQMKLNDAKDEFEREFIIAKLMENDYNISQTAQSLGIYPSNLHGKIKKFGIEIKR